MQKYLRPLQSRFQIEDIGIIFQRFPSQAQKTTEIPFSNRRYWHYFPEVPITSQKNHGNSVFKEKILALFSRCSHHKPKTKKERKSCFQIEDIGIIFQSFPSQAQKTTEILLSNRKYLHYFPEVPITSQKTREIPFSNRRYWHYFPEVPSQAQQTTEIPFSNRRYWNYFPGSHHKPKKTRKSRFQIEDIGIIFQRLPSQKHGNPVFKQKILALFSRGSHHNPKTTGIQFSNKKILALFSRGSHQKPKKPRKFCFQLENIGIIFQRLPSQVKKNNRHSVFT